MNDSPGNPNPAASANGDTPVPEGRWRRWVVNPVTKQLNQGSSPEKLAWTIAFSVTLGIFPIMGTTTMMCLLFGWLLKLNQPLLHIFKTFTYPLHLALILVFIHVGQKMHGVPPITDSIPQMLVRFQQDPMQFARDFGLAAWHGITAWLLIAPPLTLAIRFISLPLIKPLVRRKEAHS